MSGNTSQHTTNKSSPISNDTNTPAAPPSSTLVEEVAFLQTFVSSSQPTEEDAANNLSVLLRQLDTANDVAQGVESKLDKLLENLEGLLEGLEGKQDASREDYRANASNASQKSEFSHQDMHEKTTG